MSSDSLNSKKTVVLALAPYHRHFTVVAVLLGILALALLGVTVRTAPVAPLVQLTSLTVLGAVICMTWIGVVAIPSLRRRGTRIESNEEGVRLLKGSEEQGAADWADVDAIVWAQAPYELPEMTILVLRSGDGSGLVSLPIPVRAAPMQTRREPPVGMTIKEFQPWLDFVAAVRDRCEGRETFSPNFDLDENLAFRERIRVFCLGLSVLLQAMGVIAASALYTSPDYSGWAPTKQPVLHGFLQTCIALGTLMPLFTLSVKRRTGTRDWCEKRSLPWSVEERSAVLPPGRYRAANVSGGEASWSERGTELTFLAKAFFVAAFLCLASVVFLMVHGSWLALAPVALAAACFCFAMVLRSPYHRNSGFSPVSDGELEFLADGSLIVHESNGGQLNFPPESGRIVYRWLGAAEFKSEGRSYQTLLALFDPVAENEEEGQ